MDKNLIRHRLQLEQLKKDLLEQTEFTEGMQEHEGLRDATQELSVIDNHPADVGSENYERAKDISLHEKNQMVLDKVEEALEKLDNDIYGMCENCGKPIPEERLDALPYAEFCVQCKKKSEGVPHDYPRPVEELNLNSPFARSYMGDKDYTGYDGEDAWQDVAQYNKLNHVFYEETADENDETIGAVEDTDRISNDEFEEQLPD
ncbi:TraR/DksA C4-type zinc finger protein [Dethiobacter alkaliphilus]|uniref:Transcriptional regulator, TraR/DksA family n=1 Tax=Dethiobacter alkaliphilus AHT 1 TaxID=555088 RepID=C0GJQ4_DETAL|nr:TraR/DksA C4-type zinc finger protein [Dethiobacter alkaliphilus]EEG76476.1 transcriptional regulator, TraR/DksA family [Dethiobacter alkaliphilus AHT 1]